MESEKRQCDSCGKIYDVQDDDLTTENLFNCITFGKRVKKKLHSIRTETRVYNVCPECMKKILSFFE